MAFQATTTWALMQQLEDPRELPDWNLQCLNRFSSSVQLIVDAQYWALRTEWVFALAFQIPQRFAELARSTSESVMSRYNTAGTAFGPEGSM